MTKTEEDDDDEEEEEELKTKKIFVNFRVCGLVQCVVCRVARVWTRILEEEEPPTQAAIALLHILHHPPFCPPGIIPFTFGQTLSRNTDGT